MDTLPASCNGTNILVNQIQIIPRWACIEDLTEQKFILIVPDSVPLRLAVLGVLSPDAIGSPIAPNRDNPNDEAGDIPESPRLAGDMPAKLACDICIPGIPPSETGDIPMPADVIPLIPRLAGDIRLW